MAFYEQNPNRKRKIDHSRDRWEEQEDRPARRRFGPESEDRPHRRSNEGFRGEGPKKAGPSIRGRMGTGRSGGSRFVEPRGDMPRPPRRDRRELPDTSPAPKGFSDFEYRAPAPLSPAPGKTEERPQLPPENMLTGRNPIREALKTGRDLEKLLVMKGELSGSAQQIVQMAKEARIPVQVVEKARLDEITPHHQGLIAFASAYHYSTVEAMLETAKERGEAPFLIILDGVTDPQNLGAVIRSAECVGAHGVIVRERRGVGLTPAAVKASAGAVEHIKVARVTNLTRTLEQLKQEGIWAYALTMTGDDYLSVNFDGGVALVVGSEGEGVSRLTLEACDQQVSLPMMGEIDSLNASVAAGVMMYRVLATRKR